MSGSVFFPSSSSGDGSPLFGGSNTNFRSGFSSFSGGPFSATKYSSDGEPADPGEGFNPPSSPWSPADTNTGSGYTGWRGTTSGEGRASSSSPSPSLLYRDLSGAPGGQSGASNGRPDLATAAAATALWQNSSLGTRLPAPPLATLDDLNPYFSETAPSPLQAGPGSGSGSPMDFMDHGAFGSPSIRDPLRSGYGGQQIDTRSPGVPPSMNCWQSPSAPQSWSQKEFSSPMSNNGSGGNWDSPNFRGAVFKQGSLLSVVPPSNVVEPPQPSQGDTNSIHHWVTVYGFSAEQTNTVLREFEKCGPVVDHIYGHAGANWIHIRYQSTFNAERALSKNGLELSSSLIVGVKPMDQSKLDSIKGKVPSVFESTKSTVVDSNITGGRVGGGGGGGGGGEGLGMASARPYLLHTPGSEATGLHPTKSRFAKFTDLLFGS